MTEHERLPIVVGAFQRLWRSPRKPRQSSPQRHPRADGQG